MKSIPRSRTPDGKRSFLEALRDSDSRLPGNEREAIARIKILAEQGRLVLDKVSPRAHDALFSDHTLLRTTSVAELKALTDELLPYVDHPTMQFATTIWITR